MNITVISKAKLACVPRRFGALFAFAVACCLAEASYLQAFAATNSYTLEDCVRIGLENSGVALNARRDVRISDAKVKQARAEALPSLSLSADYYRLDELQKIEFGTESMRLGVLDNYSAGAEIGQLLYSGGRISAALRAAKLTRRYSQYGRMDTEMELIRDIKIGFGRVLLANEALKVRRESVDQLAALLEQTKQKFRAGKASEFDVLTAEVRLANEEPLLGKAENDLDLARHAFQRMIGLDEEAFTLVGALECDPMEGCLDDLMQTLDRHPRIIEARTLVGLRRQDVEGARSAGMPELRAFAGYDGANSYGFTAGEDEWEWHWTAGLSVTWNIWDGGLTAGTVAEKRIEVEKQETNLDELYKTMRLEIRNAYLTMKQAEKTVGAGERNVERAEKGLEIAKSRHEQGLATYLEFTDANLALSVARLNYAEALYDHMAAVARLAYATGFKLEIQLDRELEP